MILSVKFEAVNKITILHFCFLDLWLKESNFKNMRSGRDELTLAACFLNLVVLRPTNPQGDQL
ncbi:hypothetical protein EAG18_15890 [Pseudoalteromonas sp. J010]|nr:hypothetical protein EAG18_15890 [Pseudoalteromonas sp. J010]RXF07061.1 hypothetical protein D9603_00525 [Pseudoalteromonas sp. PS5]